MIQIREIHLEVLRQIDKPLPVEKTTVVLELVEYGAIKNERYWAEMYPDGLLAGWGYDVTPRGLELIDPRPPATGNTKRLVTLLG